jgi:putative acetyltransferase
LSYVRREFLSVLMIRQERREDITAISEVQRVAFEGENEARLVEEIRKSEQFVSELSLVAGKEGDIVRHILFSPVMIDTDDRSLQALALAPMAV